MPRPSCAALALALATLTLTARTAGAQAPANPVLPGSDPDRIEIAGQGAALDARLAQMLRDAARYWGGIPSRCVHSGVEINDSRHTACAMMATLTRSRGRASAAARSRSPSSTEAGRSPTKTSWTGAT